jgi:2-(1,2-epoxy-1,2-dihydrophenyl)acetyl-CoA isomerase
MTDTFTDAIFEIDGHGIATFTMNRPDVLNALTPGLKDDYIRMLDIVQDNDAVKALILTGTGRAFSAGGNVKAMGNAEQPQPDQARKRILKMHEWLVRLHNLDCPVIAAVDGLAFGGGLALALQADFVLASERASFSSVFGRIGLVPDMAVFYALPRAVGMQKAKELMYTARSMTAREADAMGLLYGVYASEELLPAARTLAERLAQGSKAAIGLTKKIVNRSFQSDYATLAELEADGQAMMFSTEFHREAVRRFQSKEPALYNWDKMGDAES